jgi:hypothetical protein
MDRAAKITSRLAGNMTNQGGKMTNRKAWQLIIWGPLGGLSPIIVSLIGAAFGSNIGQVLPWFTIVSFPVGLIIALIGVAALLRNSVKLEGKSGTNSKVVVVRFVFSLWFVLILANTIFRLFFLNQGGGILYVFELMPLAFSFWLGMQSWKLSKTRGETFDQFYRAQAIVAAVVTIGGIPAILNIELYGDLAFGGTEEERLINGSSAITSLVPVLLSILSLLFMLWAKRFQRAA